MKTDKQALGKWGEQRAAEFLKRRGYEIIERNARTKYGEIDLVVSHSESDFSASDFASEEHKPVIVFVEVKTRSSMSFGYPEQAIDARKQEHMLSAALAYLQEHPQLGDDWRIDVIAIQRLPASPPEIVHFENVLTN